MLFLEKRNLARRREYAATFTFPGEEIASWGEEIYEQHLRTTVETEENIGKIISIDIKRRRK